MLNHAPEFTNGEWLNTDQPLCIQDLRDQIVLVYIWDYTSVYCLQTLPHVRRWHERYTALGLVVVGIHAPEFDFGRERTQVQLALQELNIHYPILLDNDFKMWQAYRNQFWPALYLIDRQGRIRYGSYGAEHYGDVEQHIQVLLRELNPNMDLPPVTTFDPRSSPAPRPTPRLRGGLQQGALGNPEGYADGAPLIYRLPDERTPGAFYVSGAWQANPQYLMYQGHNEGIIHVPYEAMEVNAVLSPHADTVERMLHPQTVTVEIWQDDRALPDDQRGDDITGDGRLLVNRPRMYNLVRNRRHEQHELTLRIHNPGFAFYAFSFISRVGG